MVASPAGESNRQYKLIILILIIIASPSFKVGLSPDEKKLYAQLFKSLDPEGTGIITGEKARTTFEKSGLPPAILGEIWQIADQNNLGFLTQFGFCTAMRLIGYTQAGNHPSAQLADYPGPLPKFANLNLSSNFAPPNALQPQSTNSSFMQTQPSSIVPSNPATNHAVPQDPIPKVSPSDFQNFSKLFIKTTGSATNDLNGAKAKDIFLKAKLPTSTLSQIWSLVDRDNLGYLNLGAFVVAMHLIQGVLNGSIKELPPFLPESIWQSVSIPESTNQPGSRQISQNSIGSQQTTINHPPSSGTAQRNLSTNSQNNPWSITPAQKQQFDSIFNSLDKAHTGQLNPDQVASFLMTSKLNQQDLANVWDLSDIQNTGIFNKLEFSIALFLVNKKLSGETLPNIVPDTLVESIKQAEESTHAVPEQAQPQVPPQTTPQAASQAAVKPQQPMAPQKTAMDDLADIFGSSSAVSSPQTANAPLATQTSGNRGLQNRPSSSDLSPSSNLPRVRHNLTGSFKPTSSFGQNLMHKQPLQSPKEDDDENLIGDDVVQNKQAPADIAQPPQPPQPVEPTPSAQQERKAVNYDALRAVPPPPVKSTSSGSVPVAEPPVTSTPPANDRSMSGNSDLLADKSAISGQLSQATSDIANISNQVKSLTSQTTGLHEKKLKAEQDLQRILNTKAEFENKLKQLRTSFDNEVKQVDQVDATLASAKEETEALRSEASISEAKLNHLSSQLNEKQVTCEDLQKNNASLKEKLGYLNVEISELEKQLEAKSAENQRLSNQASVKKSQVQVSIVKTEELRNKIAELENSNKLLQDEHDKAIEREQALEAERQQLATRQAEATNFKPTTKSSPGSSHGKGLAAGAAVGAAIAGVAGAAASHLGSSKSDDADNATLNQEEKQKEIDPQEHPSDVKPSGFSVGALVDEVKDKPSADMTGIDDLQQNDPTSEHFPEPEAVRDTVVSPGQFVSVPETKEDEVDEINNRFPDMSVTDRDNSTDRDNVTNQTAPSSTNSYRHNEDGETPVTSPSNSDFQFPQNANAGVVGSLVGMPGVLVGVQRTDSLTSSVQNNAALSVRDDNIDDISDRDTIDNEVATAQGRVNSPPTSSVTRTEQQGHQEDSSEGEKLSSGVESFEIVNAEEARGIDQYNFQENKEAEPSSAPTETFVIKNPTQAQDGEEFPPIRELDYDESSSSDEDNEQDRFDDANDNFQNQSNDKIVGADLRSNAPVTSELQPSKGNDFDAAFDDLTPAAEESKDKNADLFADEFDNLETAKPDTNPEDFEANEDFGFNSEFTEAPVKQSHAPSFEQSTVPETKESNDEWEQLFAGFGNAQAQPPVQAQAQSPEPQPVTQHMTSHELPRVSNLSASQEDSVQELVGMGFDEKTVVDALQKENWDTEAATNYLLDHA